ncbi:MAG: hypothetical protein WCJ70_05015 [bacterium]
MTLSHLQIQKDLVRELESALAADPSRTTLAPMKSDFATSKERSLGAISFLSSDILSQIREKVQDPLQSADPLQYHFPTTSLHITIKNIRALHYPPRISSSDIQKAHTVLAETIPSYPPPQFHLEEVVIFPTSIALMAYAEEGHIKLIHELDDKLSQAGIPDDKKYFSKDICWANITICRFTHPPTPQLITTAKSMRHLKVSNMQMDETELLTCNEVCDPRSREVWGTYHFRG